MGRYGSYAISMFVGNKKMMAINQMSKDMYLSKSTPWVVMCQKAPKIITCSIWKMIIKKGHVSFPPAFAYSPTCRMTSPPKAPRKPSETASCDGPCRAGNNGLTRKGLGRGGTWRIIPRAWKWLGPTPIWKPPGSMALKKDLFKKKKTTPQNKKAHPKKIMTRNNFRMSPTAKKMMVS